MTEGSHERTGSVAHRFFADVSTKIAKWTGNHWAFLIAGAFVAVSLSILGIEITNVAISIVTLLMVFVLQNTQNRDSAALHPKLDEVVRVEPDARTTFSEPNRDPRRRSKSSTTTSTGNCVANAT